MADELQFDSMNPYQSLQAIVARTEKELIERLLAIKTPVRIVNIYEKSTGRICAWVMGDIRKKPGPKPKPKNEGDK